MKRALAALLVLTAACTNDVRVGQPLRRVLDVPPDRPGALDVLFVIDPSTNADVHAAADAFFGELQARLGDSLPDLHVGVISSELARNALPADCDGAHNGALRAGNGTCTNNGGSFLVDAASGSGLRVRNYDGAIADAFACVAALPATACSASQPMTALRVAVGVDEQPPDVNQGFLRYDAMLLVVIISTRDDCSPDPQQPQFFSPGEFGSKPIPERCHEAAALSNGPLVAPAAIADDLRALKRDPSMVMIGGVFAPPTSTSCGAASVEPGVRLAGLAGEFTSRYAYASICDGGAADQMTSIAKSVARVLNRKGCLLGPLPPHTACRAFAETDVKQSSIPRCDASTGGSCYTLAPSDACLDTASTLDAEPTAIPPGAHFVVECAAPPGL